MEIYFALLTTAFLIGHVTLIATYYLVQRARSLEHDADMRAVRAALERIGQNAGNLSLDPGDHAHAGAAAAAERTAAEPSPEAPRPSVIAPVIYPDDMDIPAELVGARCKETIERFAPVLGVTPVNLLREALAQGLTGGRPVTEEMLDILEEEAKSRDLSPPSKPGSSQPS
jgi:hypothetical protein